MVKTTWRLSRYIGTQDRVTMLGCLEDKKVLEGTISGHMIQVKLQIVGFRK